MPIGTALVNINNNYGIKWGCLSERFFSPVVNFLEASSFVGEFSLCFMRLLITSTLPSVSSDVLNNVVVRQDCVVYFGLVRVRGGLACRTGLCEKRARFLWSHSRLGLVECEPVC